MGKIVKTQRWAKRRKGAKRRRKKQRIGGNLRIDKGKKRKVKTSGGKLFCGSDSSDSGLLTLGKESRS